MKGLCVLVNRPFVSYSLCPEEYITNGLKYPISKKLYSHLQKNIQHIQHKTSELQRTGSMLLKINASKTEIMPLNMKEQSVIL